MASAVAGYCPRDKIYNTANCSFRITCHGTIRGIALPAECKESTNDHVTVDVTLTDADRIDDKIDQEFLPSITTLRISANWPHTTLSLLQNTIRLENLFLIGNKIESILSEPFYDLNSLSILDLSYNRLSQIDHLFRFALKPNRLRKLYLSHNIISKVAKHAFAELTSLVELDLSHNFISDVTAEPFSNLTSLEVLRLNNNSIINLNGAVNDLHNLKHLFLKGNHINNIDEESLKIINHLETFDVSSNNLDEVNSVMFMRHWEHLNNCVVFKIILSGNSITSLPNTTARNVTEYRFRRQAIIWARIHGDIFSELDLSNNHISTIEYNAFQSLTKLTALDLSNNKLIDFLINGDDVTFVRYLNLSGNFISRLYYESFSRMKNLERLDLSQNKLDYIPDQTFHNNYNLRHVNLTFNTIEKLDNLNIHMFHLNGGVVDLSNNEISKLRIPYGENFRLNVLILQNNNITDVSLIELQHQTELMNLDLSRNRIRVLNESSLRLPVSLIYLDLRCNYIEHIAPSTFLRVWRLKTLLLSYNSLNTIEYGSFRGLISLLSLDLSYNKISALDSSLMMDLKSLSVLYLRDNGLKVINDESWYGHKVGLKVYLDGNNFTCEWLASALKNYNNGYSKMRPMVSGGSISGPTLEGIPCTPENTKMARLRMPNSMVLADERLLLNTQKILEAVKEQTYYLKKFVLRSIQEDTNNVKDLY